MSTKETAIEVKVGALVLGAIAILVAFVLVLGDFSFSRGVVIYADFNNAAGLKPGAAVRLAGIPAGSVRSVVYRGGEVDEALGRPVYVRATLEIDPEMQPAIRQDAQFTITTQGVLGEPYIEISSTDPNLPPIVANAVYVGNDPPRLDMLLASAYAGIEGLRELVDRLNRRGENPIRIDDFINNIASLAGRIDERVLENTEEIDSIIANVDLVVRELAESRESIPVIVTNVESATGEFDRLGRSLNRVVGDGSELRRTVRNVDQVAAVAAREVEPLMLSARSTLETADAMLQENREGVRTTIANAEQITADLAAASTDVREMVAMVDRGEGNLGRLLQDEEIFEDMREFVRELKRRPWRLLWKE